MYTHCPNCNTHFSITQEYLDIANGKVRCGKCDYVFNALENLYNETEPHSPQLETAISDTEEEQLPSAEITTENTDDKLIPQEQEPDAKTVETPTPEPDIEAEQAEPVEVQAPFTPPLASVDIKEKMERIAASLSAATQELKNARKTVGFEQLSKEETDTNVSPFASPAEDSSTDKFFSEVNEVTVNPPLTDSETENLVPENLYDNSDDSAIKSAIEAETEATVSETAGEELTPVAPAEVIADSGNEIQDIEENTAKINAQEIVNADTAESLQADSELTEPSTPSEPPALEDELDLVDFSERQEIEDTIEPAATDFNLPPVDESDIDILNSLIENQEHEDIAPDNLIEELNDINRSLSSEGVSLDDELSHIESQLDSELDSGDDVLTELEQLENEFNATDSELNSHSNKESDDLNNEFDNEAEQEVSSISSQAQHANVPVVEEEVVPSFLTQNSSQSSSPASMFGWLFATLIMLSLLAAQYLHFNSLKLADNPDFRPFLETLCPITGCIIPLRKAPDKIITTNHDVHTHPSVNDALQIQLSFKNKADFTQAYPILEVLFSDPRGEIIARRKFSPDEYLKNNAAYVSGIKPNQTEKVDLQIVDPDPGALLSFQFNYL